MEYTKKHKLDNFLVHTGQHYDDNMSKIFFNELGLPKPDINLNVGSGTYGEQIGRVIMRLERVVIDYDPDVVLVVGDVNSTFAGALIGKRLDARVAHVEAGLRSFDLTMPEEINRILTDRISDYLFTTEESANKNLLNEGVSEDKIFFVGNVMIDTLLRHKENALKKNTHKRLGLTREEYCVVTVHRQSNVDTKESLAKIISILKTLGENIKLVLPLHPRTKKNLNLFGLWDELYGVDNLIVTEPLGYLDFLCLMANSKFVLTDSGGIQEETTILRVPCITLRDNTERPVTLTHGTNMLVSTDERKVLSKAMELVNRNNYDFKNKIPPLWDGKATERIFKILSERCQ